jgi:hypothetical protein
MTPTADDRGGGLSGPLRGELHRWRTLPLRYDRGWVIAIDHFSDNLQQGQCPFGPSGKSSHRDLRFTSCAVRQGRSPACRKKASHHEKEMTEGNDCRFKRGVNAVRITRVSDVFYPNFA